jgi:membrane associated rhomboid family serine protease
MRCPECASHRTRVVRNPTGTPGAGAFPATVALIAINVVVYLIEIAGGTGGPNSPGGSVIVDFALFGPAVAEGELYRLVTGGFLHASIIHIGFNMFLLFMLGRLLEPALGTPRFVLLYFTSLLAGSLGALVLDPNAFTVGASGAVFGLFGAGFLLARERGMDSLATQLGLLIVINLLFSLGPSHISLGGHVGGLIGGVLCAILIVAGERDMLGRNHRPAEMGAMVAIAAAAVIGSIAVA